MVLVINGCAVQDKPKSIAQFYSNFPQVRENVAKFQQKEVTIVDSKYSLYVGQGEYAIIPGSDESIKVIGSDEATTCHILILLSKTSGTVSVCHLDDREHQDQSIEEMIVFMEELDSKNLDPEVYILGGYCDVADADKRDSASSYSSRNCSQKIAMKLLDFLINHRLLFNLKLFCSCSENTMYHTNILSPRFMGLAYDRKTKEVIAANFPIQAPCISLRSALGWASPSDSLVQIYDHVSGHVTVRPFEVADPHRFRYFSTLPNDILKQHFSTSPLVEPASFVPRLKETFALLGSDCSLFPNKISRHFKLKEGSWIEI